MVFRRRITKDSIEESIIDHVLVSGDLADYLESILIDEERLHVLTRLTKTKKGVVKKQSDHNVIISKFYFQWNKKIQSERIEIYNLKNVESQLKFKQMTNDNDTLSAIFDSENDLNKATELFIKKLNKCFKSCFKKIRVSEKPNKEVEELFAKRKELRNNEDEKSKLELEQVENKLAELCAEKNYNKIKEEISDIKHEEGGINSGKLWKLKKKLSPKCRDPPTAMLDQEGDLVTSPKLIEKLAVDVFRNRLKNRQIKEELSELKKDKDETCKLRLKIAARNKTPPWTMEELNTVLKYLKKNKSRDQFGFSYELFKDNAAGNDLKLAVLKLMNPIRFEQKYPEVKKIYDIFWVSILRTILDRLIYNDEYGVIDEALSDSNVGARNGRNVRDNIFVMNAITNSVVKGNQEPIDIQVYDVQKCFDALWVEDCINDIYETGFDNDKLPLLFVENQNAMIAVKTNRNI